MTTNFILKATKLPSILFPRWGFCHKAQWLRVSLGGGMVTGQGDTCIILFSKRAVVF